MAVMLKNDHVHVKNNAKYRFGNKNHRSMQSVILYCIKSAAGLRMYNAVTDGRVARAGVSVT